MLNSVDTKAKTFCKQNFQNRRKTRKSISRYMRKNQFRDQNIFKMYTTLHHIDETVKYKLQICNHVNFWLVQGDQWCKARSSSGHSRSRLGHACGPSRGGLTAPSMSRLRKKFYFAPLPRILAPQLKQSLPSFAPKRRLCHVFTKKQTNLSNKLSTCERKNIAPSHPRLTLPLP